MTMYEFDDTEVSKGQEWLTQQTAHPDNARMREAMIHLPESPGVWRKHSNSESSFSGRELNVVYRLNFQA